MANLANITNIWNNVKEIDLRPLRNDAIEMVKVAIVGAPGSGRSALADQMRRDPAREGAESQSPAQTQTPVLILGLDDNQPAYQSDLVILMLPADKIDLSAEKELAVQLVDSGKKVLLFVNYKPAAGADKSLSPWVNWRKGRVIYGPVDDSSFLVEHFVPRVIELLPNALISLARHFPLFRVAVAHHLINETSLANATYALSTGLAEVVPAFDIPLNVADIVVLTKAQAFLVYKLGLALGLSTEWRDYVNEFGSVLGGGFLWRQIARSLIGLIPAWGIIPKVAVAYSGTQVVGNVILQWYLTGRHVSRQQMRILYQEAFERGKGVARGLLEKVPRPPRRRRILRLPSRNKQTCPNCGQVNALDARYCQNCGEKLTDELENE